MNTKLKAVEEVSTTAFTKHTPHRFVLSLESLTRHLNDLQKKTMQPIGRMVYERIDDHIYHV